jgi:hypothetical protein
MSRTCVHVLFIFQEVTPINNPHTQFITWLQPKDYAGMSKEEKAWRKKK